MRSNLKGLISIFAKLKKNLVHRFSIYGISADETTDASNKEQLCLVLRYAITNNVVERLHECIDCKSITGESVCCETVSILKLGQL